MIWFWSRDDGSIQVETRYDNDTFEFVIALQHPDGRQESQRFQDIREFGRRVVELEQWLEADRWKQSGTPVLDPSGFPTRRRPVEQTGPAIHPDRAAATTKRHYAAGPRNFEITLSSTPLRDESLWTVERVKDTSRAGQEVIIPGMNRVVESTEEAAFAVACARIDKWLRADS